MAHELHHARDGRVAWLTLRGAHHNALDRPAIEELRMLLEQLSTESSLRAVVLAGAGEHFCAGRVRDPEQISEEGLAADLEPVVALNAALDRVPVPVIAAVEGEALGFGFGLAALCDVTLASSDARFALTELSHGIPPLIVLSFLVGMLPYKVAVDLALSGRELDGDAACRLGLVAEVVAPGQLKAGTEAYLDRILAAPAEAVMLLRRFARARAALFPEALAREGLRDIAALLATREAPLRTERGG